MSDRGRAGSSTAPGGTGARPPERDAEDPCPNCGAALAERRPTGDDLRWPVAVLLAGCFLSLYLVGLALIGLGAWLWSRQRPAVVCPSCDDGAPAS